MTDDSKKLDVRIFDALNHPVPNDHNLIWKFNLEYNVVILMFLVM